MDIQKMSTKMDLHNNEIGELGADNLFAPEEENGGNHI